MRSSATERLLRLTARNARRAHRAPRRVAGAGRLDLDHVGAHVGEHLPAERPGHHLGELEHPQAVEGAVHHAGTDAASSSSSAAPTPWLDVVRPRARRPISTPHSVPASIRSLKSPRWPIRNTRPASLPEPGAERHVEALEDHAAHLVGVVAAAPRSASRSTRARRRRAPRGPSRARPRAWRRRGGRGGRTRSRAPPRAASRAPRAGRRAGSSPTCRASSRPALASMIGSQSQYERGSSRRCDAASAFSETALKLEPGRQHQALLRAADGDVDAPLVVAVVDRAERRDRVDEQQRVVAGGVDRRADLRHAARHAGRGLVVHDHHRGDVGSSRSDRLRALGVGAVAPVALDPHDLEPEPLGHRAPERREVAGLEREHAVARARAC